MLIASRIHPAGSWDESTAADRVVLDLEGRHRRRHALTGRAGLAFLLDLPRAALLRDGDGLVLDDGRVVCVRAAAEPLTEITAPDAAALVRMAWHLGNRHLSVQLLDGRLRIRRDPVIATMLQGLGATVVDVEAPFDPEGGAFDVAAHHRHDPGHGHGHDEAP